jgi:membrane protein implicated in regulation of membrane protease activity
MTMDQVFPAAIVAVLLLLIVAGIVRVVGRRRGGNDAAFGAGGTSTVPIGTLGVAKTNLEPSGVVHVVGEQWTARSDGAAAIASGTRVRVVGQDGLTLIVVAEPAGSPAEA